jgi:hypothetical protein
MRNDERDRDGRGVRRVGKKVVMIGDVQAFRKKSPKLHASRRPCTALHRFANGSVYLQS